MAHGDYHDTQSVLEIRFLHNSSRGTTRVEARNERVKMRRSKTKVVLDRTFLVSLELLRI
jgi:hypothetical protein